jgi:hypothetical protein
MRKYTPGRVVRLVVDKMMVPQGTYARVIDDVYVRPGYRAVAIQVPPGTRDVSGVLFEGTPIGRAKTRALFVPATYLKRTRAYVKSAREFEERYGV